LTVETISRLLGRFQKSGMSAVKVKYISILDEPQLAELAGAKKKD
jgi:CRP/FNR family transcriptional regulator